MIEVKSVVPDIQGSLVTLDRKERLALGIAQERGWNAVGVSRLLVIRENRTARRRIAEHAATFANTFPDRARVVRGWLMRPDPSRPLRGLWFLSSESQADVKHVSAGRDARLSVAQRRRIDIRPSNRSIDNSAPPNVRVRFV